MLSGNIASFLDYCQSLCYSKKTLQALKTPLFGFNSYVNNRSFSSISEVAYPHLMTFVIGAPNDSPAVRKMRVWTLRRFFGYLKLQGIITDNPTAKLCYPKIEKRVPRFLTAVEFRDMLTYLCRDVDKPHGLRNLLLVLLMGVLGLRISAIYRLNIGDVDLRLGRLFVQEKGGSQRFLVLPALIVILLDRYLAEHPLRNPSPSLSDEEALFLSRRKQRFSISAMQRLISQIAKRCGYPGRVHPHLFRHTAGTQLNQVADIHIVREVLGHQREDHTRRYVHLNPHEYGEYMRRHPYIKDEL